MGIRRIAGLLTSGLFGTGFVTMALITLLPSDASKPNMLGYYSVCSYTPISTLILISLSALFIMIGYSIFYRFNSTQMKPSQSSKLAKNLPKSGR